MRIMTSRLAAITLALGALVPPAQAQAPQSFRVISPIFGQLVTFSMPSNFVAAFENTKGGHYIREAVLRGESAQAWTQMITVTGEKGVSSNPGLTPEKFAGNIAGGFKAACPDSFGAKGLGTIKLGSFDAFIAVIGCGNVDSGPAKHSETALLVTVKGVADYYTIQWAERGAASDKPKVDDEKWTARLRELRPIDLCPIVAGEKAPYPSCVNKS
ncbi:hypothetical protein JQ596_34910 [Bradyrhizobium manausense]|uniref:hypothetical protein n=2 Tax=Bradyrhizobium TaxID=374 RepID=UPI001BA60EE9|nr:hypothetical protein [Bradyrhizobium manausense]MBR0830711.1 hypothetical protein [Bradyrhizobium manausense]UVO31089.1 hypothetical protein KUF59_10795 [Bradyrhizobium arachidis]